MKSIIETHPSLCTVENGFYRDIGSCLKSDAIPNLCKDGGVNIPEGLDGARYPYVELIDIQKHTVDKAILRKTIEEYDDVNGQCPEGGYEGKAIIEWLIGKGLLEEEDE